MSRRIAFANDNVALPLGGYLPQTQSQSGRAVPAARSATNAPNTFGMHFAQPPVQVPHAFDVLARGQYLNGVTQRSSLSYGYTIPTPQFAARAQDSQALPALPSLSQRAYSAVTVPVALSGDSRSQSRAHVCDICGMGFSREHDLRRHSSAVHIPDGSSVPICNRCGRPFGHTDALRRHIQRGCTFIPPEDLLVLPPALERCDPSGYFSS